MDYIGVQEVAKRTGASIKTVLKYCQNGQINGCYKSGKSWYIPENEIFKLSKQKTASFKFIDLFCGIGGFHQAMSSLGGECVFACDIDDQCRDVYRKNFCPNDEFPLHGDIIKAIDQHVIPKFDVLCGGFPCQTFSKAGLQNGFKVVENKHGKKDERGQLFYRIIDILAEHPECKYIVLENVRNLADKKENWDIICSELKKQDFIITEEPLIVSPHEYGIPQVRERVLILGIRKSVIDGRRRLQKGYITSDTLHAKEYQDHISVTDNCLESILDKVVDDKYIVSAEIEEVLNIWEEFKENVIGLASPFWIHKAGIGIYSREEYLTDPDVGYMTMPDWKKKLVMRSRIVYENNFTFIDEWIKRHDMLSRQLLHQKFEWNAGNDCETIRDGIIQVRQSGIRVKRPNFFPSLVAMNNKAIIWDKGIKHFRYMTPREAARLQSFNENYIFSDVDSVTYRQLGNSVNVKLVKIFANELFQLGKRNNPPRKGGKTNG